MQALLKLLNYAWALSICQCHTCLLFIVCLTAHRHLGHIGPTLGVDALSCHAQDIGRQTYRKFRDRTACLKLTIVAHLGDWLPPLPSWHWLALQNGELAMPSKARMVLTSAVATATIQAQQTRMIAHSHSFKTTLCQWSKADMVTHSLPAETALPI